MKIVEQFRICLWLNVYVFVCVPVALPSSMHFHGFGFTFRFFSSRQCSSSSHIFLFCFLSCVRCRFYINLVCMCTLFATWRLFIVWNGRLFDPIACNVVCVLMASRETLATNKKNTHMQTVREEARRAYVFFGSNGDECRCRIVNTC